MSISLGLLAINTSLNLEKVNNRRPIDISAPRNIVYSARMQGTPSTGTSLNQVRNSMHSMMKIPISTWMDVYPSATLLSINSTILIRI